MTNIIWILLIIILLFLSFKITKEIKFKNYKVSQMIQLFKTRSKKGLFLTLGTKIGVGSIIGTTMSIYIGGPGSVLWIILFSLITSSLIYYESYVGSKYKENSFSGPYYYIKNALKNKWLAITAMILLIICYSFLFQMVQTNTVKNILEINFYIKPIVVAIVFFIILIFIIFFSIKELLNSMNKIVPIMCLIYLTLGIICIIKNFDQVGDIILLIVNSAFNKRGILIGLIIGVKRAIFLNEIMIGTTSSGSGVDDIPPRESALIQTLGMYFITFVICIVTSLLVLLFKQNNLFYINNYNELICNVFIYHFGKFGPFILIITIFLFALTTIMSGCYIGETNLRKIFSNNKIILIFKIFMLLFCIGGVFIETDIIWKYVDILMYLLIIINSYSLYKIYRGEKNDRERLGYSFKKYI